MKIRRKSNQCLNCGATLDEVYNYCPRCGQENNDNTVSFKMLIRDFFNTYLAIDSRFGRSVRPFFFQPGYLTNKYIDGKRMTYAHPLRLYFIISIFYFFTVALAAREAAKNDDEVVKSEVELGNLNELNALPKDTRKKLLTSLKSSQRKELDSIMADGAFDELTAYLSSLDSSRQLKVRKAIGDSTANILALVQSPPEKSKPEVEIDEDELGIGELLSRIDSETIRKYDRDYDGISDEQIYDSLNVGSNVTGFKKRVVLQAIRISRADTVQVSEYVVKNMPLMMLLLIPVFALILKLFYLRRNQLYIKHIVHGLHLHSFAYLIYGINILVWYSLITDETYAIFWHILGFTIVTVYAYLSFKNVYKQKWLKTFVKFNMIGLIYSTTILVFFVIEMIISLLIF